MNALEKWKQLQTKTDDYYKANKDEIERLLDERRAIFKTYSAYEVIK